MYYTIKETVAALKSGETTSEKLVRSSIDTFTADQKSEKPLNAFLEIYEDALELAKMLNKRSERIHVLDNLLTYNEIFNNRRIQPIHN